MKSVYGDPAYAQIEADLHEKLTELRTKYGDSEELDKQFLERFLEGTKK